MISTDDGLNFAFGITEFDGNIEPIDDANYGQLKAHIIQWGINPDVAGSEYIDLPLHRCVEIRGENQSEFYDAHKHSVSNVQSVM